MTVKNFLEGYEGNNLIQIYQVEKDSKTGDYLWALIEEDYYPKNNLDKNILSWCNNISFNKGYAEPLIKIYLKSEY